MRYGVLMLTYRSHKGLAEQTLLLGGYLCLLKLFFDLEGVILYLR